jgi:phage host-nuclease inhibitor protein Gam
MARIKSTSFKTREEFDAAVNQAAALQTEMRTLTAKRDKLVQRAQGLFAEGLKTREQQLKGLVALAEKYAEKHREELLPAKAKSAATELATFGFRLGNPTLSLLNKKCSWLGVVLACKALKFPNFIRTIEEADKEAIKAATLTDAQRSALGVKITQSETFFIEPKVEGGEAIKAEAS